MVTLWTLISTGDSLYRITLGLLVIAPTSLVL